MKKSYMVLGLIMILLGAFMLYSSIANIEISPILKIILGVIEISLGIFVLVLKKK